MVGISNSVSISNHHWDSWILGSVMGTGHMVTSSVPRYRSFILMDRGVAPAWAADDCHPFLVNPPPGG